MCIRDSCIYAQCASSTLYIRCELAAASPKYGQKLGAQWRLINFIVRLARPACVHLVWPRLKQGNLCCEHFVYAVVRSVVICAFRISSANGIYSLSSRGCGGTNKSVYSKSGSIVKRCCWLPSSSLLPAVIMLASCYVVWLPEQTRLISHRPVTSCQSSCRTVLARPHYYQVLVFRIYRLSPCRQWLLTICCPSVKWFPHLENLGFSLDFF